MATATTSGIKSLGFWLVDLMSEEQLAAAAHAYHAKTAISKQFFLDSTLLVQAWNNHWRSGSTSPPRMPLLGGELGVWFRSYTQTHVLSNASRMTATSKHFRRLAFLHFRLRLLACTAAAGGA